MHRIVLQRLQDEHIERALQQLRGRGFLRHDAFLDVLGKSGVKLFLLEYLGEQAKKEAMRPGRARGHGFGSVD
jgi:hypothetical protein